MQRGTETPFIPGKVFEIEKVKLSKRCPGCDRFKLRKDFIGLICKVCSHKK